MQVAMTVNLYEYKKVGDVGHVVHLAPRTRHMLC